ncbi:hypothetical protein GCM10025865_12690 [Paraoerskovia sediminicola]|uniref:ABC transmembrane type-1 domain-containing protein n=1 Tax=Paraoerskovia sediminicola TaxID=1138587 RepID=A0ABM8G1Q7_9CELL|nr:sugar ABC transporter permease [Paraoerskovia sediminicola]BDZ41970.1 hypothetical protein GCM10025865_12690 [Paraoerskovia sediminicola]
MTTNPFSRQEQDLSARKYSRADRKLRRTGWLMVLPSLLHIGLWTAIPVVVTFYLAFTNYNVFSAPTWVGIDNFVEIAQDPVFRKATWNTVVYTFWTVPVSMGIALVIAVALNQGLRFQKWYRTAFFLPQVTATVAIAMVWLWIFNPQQGLLNAFLGMFGIPGQVWLADPQWALWSVILVGAWQGIGIKMLIYIAALQNVDESSTRPPRSTAPPPCASSSRSRSRCSSPRRSSSS